MRASPMRDDLRAPRSQARGRANTHTRVSGDGRNRLRTSSTDRSVLLLQQQIEAERARRQQTEKQLLHALSTLAGRSNAVYSHFSEGNIEPINAGESGIERLPAGVKMDTMYRPPTADVKEAFRQGVPTLGVRNVMWHSTFDEGLGSTHCTHRSNRFLAVDRVPQNYFHTQGCHDRSHIMSPEFGA